MKLLYILILMALFACGNPPKTADKQTNTPNSSENSGQNFVPQTFPIAYYIATEYSGSWVLELSMEQNGSYSAVLKDSSEGMQYRGNFQKSPPIVNGKVVVTTNETLFNGIFEENNSGQAAVIRIKGEECKSKDGVTYPSVCEIKFGKKVLTGCGKYVD